MLVSVIVPAYNCERYLSEALASALSQGESVGEIIVVDDGSTDGTRRVARSFGDAVTLVTQPNQGPAAARNAGLSIARGDYIAFLDGDDVWLPGKISAQLDYLGKNPHVKFVHGRIHYWRQSANGGEVPAPDEGFMQLDGIDDEMSGWIYPQLLLDSAVCTITVMMHREVYERVGGFDERLRTGEDYEYWLRISRSFEMHKLSRYLARYRLHEGGTTREPRTEPNELKVMLRALEEYGRLSPSGMTVDDDAVRERLARLWFEHGHLHYWRGDRRVAADAFRNALRHRRSMRGYVYWMLSALSARTGTARPAGDRRKR